MSTCITAICVFAAFLVPGQVNDVLRDADPAWLAAFDGEVDEQMRFLAAAYDLDEATKAELKQELKRRLLEQYEYDQTTEQEWKDLEKSVGEGVSEDFLLERLNAIHEHMPLNPDTTAAWLDGQVSPEVAAKGRQRLGEIRRRKIKQQEAEDADLNRLGGAKRKRMLARQARGARRTSGGKPMPHGPKADPVNRRNKAASAERFVHPGEASSGRTATASKRMATAKRHRSQVTKTRGTTENGVSEGVSKTPPARRRSDARRRGKASREPTSPDAPFAKAPPLDEWDKHVAKVAEKYGFDQGQVTKAQSILRDLRRRAYQYQMTRSVDFANAELLEGKKARRTRVDELNRPLDALFDELKQRLEALPTMAQRQRAEKTPTDRKRK